jgi:hypothetical protein
MGTIFVGALLLLGTIDQHLQTGRFFVSMAVAGVGMGLIMSQIGNVNLSSVPSEQASEVGGLQGTAQNLGSALGTALIGSILLTSLTGAFHSHVKVNEALSPAIRQEVETQTSGGLQFVPAGVATKIVMSKGATPEVATELTGNYAEAQIRALKTGLGGVAVIVLLGFFVTFGLPREPLAASG